MYGSDLKEGTKIADRYILKEYKGSGSFGEVWLAEDSELGLDVAIKLYISLDQKGQDEFKDEYKVAYGLSHENLLTAQYYSVWEYRPYLIMKYCSRGSASSMGGNATEADIWKFIHDVASGLKYLHAQEPPIVHQDIKPENILIDEQGRYLITDFGISKKMRTTMRKQSKRSIESGAIAYMGPERFLKDPMAVKASDIWSLGVSIYELATNDLPFLGQGGGMLNAGAAIPELNPEQWSVNLNEIMQACLAKETWDRPTAEELADYSQQILKGKNISWQKWKAGETAAPAETNDKPAPISSSSSKKWILITAVCAVLATLLCVFIFGGGDSSDEQNERLHVEQRYANLLSMCENNINVGDAQNYTSLFSAKELLDSLKLYQDTYPYIAESPENSLTTIESRLDVKCADAAKAWARSAEGQLNVAEDVTSAIVYYQLSYQLYPEQTVLDALETIKRQYNCPTALMAITHVELSGNNLIVDYNGLNTEPISDVSIFYKLMNESGDAKLRGTADITIQPGNDWRLTISLDERPSDVSQVQIGAFPFGVVTLAL